MNHRPTLNTLLALACALATGAATAGPRVGSVMGARSSTSSTVQAKVISATPVVAQVAVPRQICRDELYQEPARSSGAGALLGAIAGGVVGNALGKGGGNALATGVGVIGGAVLGNHIESDGRQDMTRSVRRCEQQASYENQVVAYDVVYEYAGQRYSTQMDEEPGRTIPLQVTVNPVGYPGPVAMAPQPEPYYEPGVGSATYYQPNPGVVIYGGAPARGWHGERRWHDRGGHHRWD
ncbi:glycine zipper 2TM domain-containing protein [Aquabacterium sp.]|uniref:glycine zipper 2TM domain-containing protein n=1 Tax=Aquabacterium sp. TaxID=1872578 RepID=UPI00248977D5|nr:glycine zipper 2TM domain-containing protein [Aquabacterium sp.]MDI1258517.1 glycine zipper 2TM domain-containing protein [Aquabacterium sp.]